MARAKKAAPEAVAETPVVEEAVVAEETPVVEEAPVAEEAAAEAEEPEAPKAEPKKRGRKPGSTNKTKTAAAEKTATEFVVQFDGKDADVNAIEERVKAQFVAEGHRAGTIKSLKIYIKPEDYAAYYVINEKFSGRVDLF